jgi:hypothetical protein
MKRTKALPERTPVDRVTNSLPEPVWLPRPRRNACIRQVLHLNNGQRHSEPKCLARQTSADRNRLRRREQPALK